MSFGYFSGERTPPDAPDATLPSERVATPVEVEVPTVGRLVHFRIDVSGDEVVLRPALVLARGEGKPGVLQLQVFLLSSDIPYAPATGLRIFNGGYFVTARWGPETGEWRWPDYGGDPEFFAEIPASVE